MIDYIKYKIDGVSYNLVNNSDGNWSSESTSPSVAGNYSLIFEISENGMITYIDSTDPRYELYLSVIISAERVTFLADYVPEFITEMKEINAIYDIENIAFDQLHADIEKIKTDAFITTASNDAITWIENFIRIKGIGTLEQRKSYLISLLQGRSKLSETNIKDITREIAGADCIVNFFGSNEAGNPQLGYGLLRVQVLSPDNNKNYRYEDIARTLTPLVPIHIKLLVVKYFATWGDIKANYADWSTISATADWTVIRNYIPPQ